jgi:DNA-directed RNA polymerase I and III subunit RPAC1
MPQNFKVRFYSTPPRDPLRPEVENESLDTDLTFSLIGLDTSIANAFRRILIAEVPTLAIESVFMLQNTSIIQDEVLAHRLGLIPIRGEREGLRWMKWYTKPAEDGVEKDGSPSDYNCAMFKLEIECKWQEGGLERAAKGETDPNKLYENHTVYARDLEWVPIGKQLEIFKNDPIRAANPGIIIAKMRPGQQISLLMHAFKGIGQDHAKFSPVATATYRLMPTIDILRPIIGADAKKFARCFPKGVIKLEEVTSDDTQKHSELRGKEGEFKAVVDNPMMDTVSRECLRHAEFKDKVKLGRIRDHFIFRIESTGQWGSEELFLESVRLLKIKAHRVKRGMAEMT